jgi:hypothetical protein
MKIVWVLENITKNKYFYGKFNILLLLASVHLWRKNHKEDTCYLYADDMTIDLLDSLKVLDFWHKIKPIPSGRKINKSVFWASSKLQVLSEIEEPIIIMDNDTHVYKPIKHLLELDKYYVCNYEIGKGYYPTSVDPYIKKLSYKPRWKTESVNVGFLNLPDPDFTKKYANLSLELMEELTFLKAPNPQYLIFSEQLLLKHLLDENNLEHKSIISTYWNCKQWNWGDDHSNGIWKYEESEKYFKHYGPGKLTILDDTTGSLYNEHIKHLLNCIYMPTLDLTKLQKR